MQRAGRAAIDSPAQKDHSHDRDKDQKKNTPYPIKYIVGDSKKEDGYENHTPQYPKQVLHLFPPPYGQWELVFTNEHFWDCSHHNPRIMNHELWWEGELSKIDLAKFTLEWAYQIDKPEEIMSASVNHRTVFIQ